jgi:hypothetical protein
VEKGVERREKGRIGSRGEDARRRARGFVMLRERMRIPASYPTPTPIPPHRNTPHHPLFRPPSPPTPFPPGPASLDEPHVLFPLPFTIRLRGGALAKVHTQGENERGFVRPTRRSAAALGEDCRYWTVGEGWGVGHDQQRGIWSSTTPGYPPPPPPPPTPSPPSASAPLQPPSPPPKQRRYFVHMYGW